MQLFETFEGNFEFIRGEEWRGVVDNPHTKERDHGHFEAEWMQLVTVERRRTKVKMEYIVVCCRVKGERDKEVLI